MEATSPQMNTCETSARRTPCDFFDFQRYEGGLGFETRWTGRTLSDSSM